MMSLKPQDVCVALKLAAGGPEGPVSYAALGAALRMSASEAHASVKRARASGLMAADGFRPRVTALEEFLIHGLKYVFPAERGGMTRGVVTSYGAEPLRAEVAAGDEPVPVWPYAKGAARGVALMPLWRTVPEVALEDAAFYEYLALVDALREGRTRERKRAEAELRRRLWDADARWES